MKLYDEKLKGYKEENVPINTKQIMKALRKVLRQHADVFTDGEANSSAGSDKAPSEDNLDPEEIAAVVPVEEDPDFIKRTKISQNLKAEDKTAAEVPKIIISPLKRRVTLGPKTKTASLIKPRKNE